MGIRIELSEKLIRDAVGQGIIDHINIEYENVDRFADWVLETYISKMYALGEDLVNQLPHSGWSLPVAFMQLLPDHDTMRLDWFRHNHRNDLLTIQQAVDMLGLGKEIWVCNYCTDTLELDQFTTVTYDDFDESEEESEVEWLLAMKAWAK